MTTIGGAPPRTRRRRTDRLASAWLVAAVVLAAIGIVGRSSLPQPLWTLVHVVTLGVLTNAILQWSWYFARTLLRLSEDDRRAGRDAVIRTVAFNIVLVALFAAMWRGAAMAAAALAVGVALVISWHGMAMLRAGRTRLASRFAVVVRFYVAASAFLVAGSVIASLLSVALLSPDPADWLLGYQDRLTVAHAVVNLGGWVGLSIAGTVVTLGPTMLRTRIDERAVSHAIAALPWLVLGITAAAIAATVGWPPGVGLGLLCFATALLAGIAVPLVRTALAKAPRTYATWTMAAGFGWIVVGLVAVATCAFLASGPADLRAITLPWIAVLLVGGIGQVFIGALTYLLPVVIGGGPRALRSGMVVLETAWPARVALRNSALAVIAATGALTSQVHPWLWSVVLVAFGIDVVLFAVAGARQARSRRADAAAPSHPANPTSPSTSTRRTL